MADQYDNTRPPCPRCGRPSQRIDVSTREEPDAWIWGCDCPPGATMGWRPTLDEAELPISED